MSEELIKPEDNTSLLNNPTLQEFFELLRNQSLGKIGIDQKTDELLSKETDPKDIKEKGTHPYVDGKKYIGDVKAVDRCYEWKVVQPPSYIGNIQTGVAICTCVGQLTINGISRQGVGTYLIPCYTSESPSWKFKLKDNPDLGTDPRIGQPMLEHAPKSAETSAFKRAAEKFGIHLDVTGEAPEESPASKLEILNIVILADQLEDEDKKKTEILLGEKLREGKFTRALYFKWRSILLSDIDKMEIFDTYIKKED